MAIGVILALSPMIEAASARSEFVWNVISCSIGFMVFGTFLVLFTSCQNRETNWLLGLKTGAERCANEAIPRPRYLFSRWLRGIQSHFTEMAK